MKKILYFDMDNVLVDFESALLTINQNTLEKYAGKLDEIPNVFSLMQPMNGAIEAFNILSEHFDVYILSTAPWHNPTAWHDKLIWVQKHLGEKAYKRLILTHNKHLNIGDYLIDDRLKNGVDKFTGFHIHFGSSDFPNWDSVVNFLLHDLAIEFIS